jgi:hypothetical protein
MTRKIICWAIALLVISIYFPSLATADGGVFGKKYTVGNCVLSSRIFSTK